MANCEALVMSSMPKRVKAVLLSNIITGPRCSAKYGRSFAGEFLLYKLQTWPIRMGLRSQTTSAIITNDWRSPGNTNPVRIGLKTAKELKLTTILAKQINTVNNRIKTTDHFHVFATKLRFIMHRKHKLLYLSRSLSLTDANSLHTDIRANVVSAAATLTFLSVT